jgi:hypothetical protein
MKCFIAPVVRFVCAAQLAAAQAESVAAPTNTHVPAVVADTAAPAATHAPAPAAAHPAADGQTPASNPAAAVPASAATSGGTPWYGRRPVGRLEAGTRYTHYKLKETRRGGKVDGHYVDTFLGSLSELEEDQDRSPNKVFIQYKPCPYAGLGVSYDHVRAVTMDSGGGDGTVDAEGPILYVTGCYPNRTRATPYCELGYVMYNTHFDENRSWSSGGRRAITVHDSSGPVLAAGLDVRVWRKISAGVYYRWVDADTVKAEFHSDGELMERGDFPIRNEAYGLTLKFVF